MSEDIREHVDRALEVAVVSNADLDEVQAILEDAQNRVEDLQTLRSGNGGEGR